MQKYDKILMLTKSKLNSIATISQALIDMKIIHEEFITILKEKDKYEKVKESLKSENEKYEIMRLSKKKEKKLFSCVYIKCFKSAKKNIKNVKLKLLTKKLLGKRKRFRSRVR